MNLCHLLHEGRVDKRRDKIHGYRETPWETVRRQAYKLRKAFLPEMENSSSVLQFPQFSSSPLSSAWHPASAQGRSLCEAQPRGLCAEWSRGSLWDCRGQGRAWARALTLPLGPLVINPEMTASTKWWNPSHLCVWTCQRLFISIIIFLGTTFGHDIP